MKNTNNNNKKISKFRKFILKAKELLFGSSSLELWGKKKIEESFDASSHSFRKIYNRRIKINKAWRVTRITTTLLFVVLGSLSMFVSSYFIFAAFGKQSFKQNFDPYYADSTQIVLHFDQKSDNSSPISQSTITSDLEREFSSLFSEKLLDSKKYSIRDFQISALSNNEISIQGPKPLVAELVRYYKIWTTSRSMSVTDPVGDTISCGTGQTSNNAHSGWLYNYTTWIFDHYLNSGGSFYAPALDGNGNQTSAYTQYSAQATPTNINNYFDNYLAPQVNKIAFSDCKNLGNQGFNSDLFSDVYQKQLNKSNDYILTFDVNDTSKWQAFTKFMYDLMKPLMFDMRNSSNSSESDSFFGVSNKGFDKNSKCPAGSNDCLEYSYNSALHFYTFLWYGNAPILQKGQDYFQYLFPGFNTSNYDQLEGTHGAGAYDTFFGDFKHEYNNLNSWASTLKTENKLTFKNNIWQEDNHSLFGIYTIDYSSNFANGLSSGEVDFDNNSTNADNIKTQAYNNFIYPIKKDYSSTAPDESKKATNDLSTSLRSSLGTIFWHILGINYQSPLLFSYEVLWAFLGGVALICILIIIYLVIAYRRIGLLVSLGLIVFILSMISIFIIFKVLFQPSSLIIFLTGIILYIANALLMLKWIHKSFIVPEEKTLFEATTDRFKRIFYRMVEFNLLLFVILFLSYNLVLGIFQGGSLVICAYLVAIFIILSSFLLLTILTLLENSKRMLANPTKLGITAYTSFASQKTNLHYYPEKIFAEKEEEQSKKQNLDESHSDTNIKDEADHPITPEPIIKDEHEK